jgi:hypothetical protein
MRGVYTYTALSGGSAHGALRQLLIEAIATFQMGGLTGDGGLHAGESTLQLGWAASSLERTAYSACAQVALRASAAQPLGGISCL